ncbi:hypothetical protein AB0L30_35765 [Microbispora rosea]
MTVADDGEAIALAGHERIFQRFAWPYAVRGRDRGGAGPGRRFRQV